MQLPTPELCISSTPLSPPSQAPQSRATPSSSVVRVTVCMSLSAMQRRIRREWPASGTRATWRMPLRLSTSNRSSGQVGSEGASGMGTPGWARDLRTGCAGREGCGQPANRGSERRRAGGCGIRDARSGSRRAGHHPTPPPFRPPGACRGKDRSGAGCGGLMACRWAAIKLGLQTIRQPQAAVVTRAWKTV